MFQIYQRSRDFIFYCYTTAKLRRFEVSVTPKDLPPLKPLNPATL